MSERAGQGGRAEGTVLKLRIEYKTVFDSEFHYRPFCPCGGEAQEGQMGRRDSLLTLFMESFFSEESELGTSEASARAVKVHF